MRCVLWESYKNIHKHVHKRVYCKNAGLLGAFLQSRKAPITFVAPVRLSPARTSATPTLRISAKFDIGTFYENLSRKSKSGYNRAKILGWHEDLNAFFVAGGNKSPQKLSLRPKFHQAVSPSVCPQVSARFPLDGLPWNLILGGRNRSRNYKLD